MLRDFPAWELAWQLIQRCAAQAVLHHVASRARRLRLLRELARALRPGGRALLTVWASEQEDAAQAGQVRRARGKGFKALKPYCLLAPASLHFLLNGDRCMQVSAYK